MKSFIWPPLKIFPLPGRSNCTIANAILFCSPALFPNATSLPACLPSFPHTLDEGQSYQTRFASIFSYSPPQLRFCVPAFLLPPLATHFNHYWRKWSWYGIQTAVFICVPHHTTLTHFGHRISRTASPPSRKHHRYFCNFLFTVPHHIIKQPFGGGDELAVTWNRITANASPKPPLLFLSQHRHTYTCFLIPENFLLSENVPKRQSWSW